MSNQVVAKCVFVYGEVELKIKAREGKISPIYEILANAPKISSDKYALIYEVIQPIMWKIPSPENDFTDKIRLRISAPALNRSLEEAFNEINEFNEYIKRRKEIGASKGYISVRLISQNVFNNEEGKIHREEIERTMEINI